MQKQRVSFEEVYDVFAIRIILESDAEHEKADAWRTYSIVTDYYQPNPDRLRDWISLPKANGYEPAHHGHVAFWQVGGSSDPLASHERNRRKRPRSALAI